MKKNKSKECEGEGWVWGYESYHMVFRRRKKEEKKRKVWRFIFNIMYTIFEGIIFRRVTLQLLLTPA